MIGVLFQQRLITGIAGGARRRAQDRKHVIIVGLVNLLHRPRLGILAEVRHEEIQRDHQGTAVRGAVLPEIDADMLAEHGQRGERAEIEAGIT